MLQWDLIHDRGRCNRAQNVKAKCALNHRGQMGKMVQTIHWDATLIRFGDKRGVCGLLDLWGKCKECPVQFEFQVNDRLFNVSLFHAICG